MSLTYVVLFLKYVDGERERERERERDEREFITSKIYILTKKRQEYFIVYKTIYNIYMRRK
jgi:hypothetical protein